VQKYKQKIKFSKDNPQAGLGAKQKDGKPPQHRGGGKNNIKNQNAKCKDTNKKLNFRKTTPKQAWGLNKRMGNRPSTGVGAKIILKIKVQSAKIQNKN